MPQEKTGAFSGHGEGNRARHGTYSGYMQHILYKVPFPEDGGGKACGCREANADYKRDNRRRKLAEELQRSRRPAPVTFRPPPDDPGGDHG